VAARVVCFLPAMQASLRAGGGGRRGCPSGGFPHTNMFAACVALRAPASRQSKWTRAPRRRKRGPAFEGYQLHIRGALAASDARKARLMLDRLAGRTQDVTGSQARTQPLSTL
jgi:hypothetical protein